MDTKRLVIDIEPELKKKFQMKCLGKGKKMAEVVRVWIERDIAKLESGRNEKRKASRSDKGTVQSAGVN